MSIDKIKERIKMIEDNDFTLNEDSLTRSINFTQPELNDTLGKVKPTSWFDRLTTGSKQAKLNKATEKAFTDIPAVYHGTNDIHDRAKKLFHNGTNANVDIDNGYKENFTIRDNELKLLLERIGNTITNGLNIKQLTDFNHIFKFVTNTNSANAVSIPDKQIIINFQDNQKMVAKEIKLDVSDFSSANVSTILQIFNADKRLFKLTKDAKVIGNYIVMKINM